MPRTYNHGQVETALCLWEAMLEMRPNLPALDADWLAHGTAAMRNSVVGMVDACDAEYAALDGDTRDGICFDWGFCPGFIYRRYMPCPVCEGKGAKPETGEDCAPCYGGGLVIP